MIFLINFLLISLGSYLSAYVYIIIYRRLSSSNKSFIINDYFILISFSILFATNNLYNPILFKVVTSMLILGLLFNIIFKDDYNDILYYVIFITLISLIVELIISVILSFVVNNVYLLNDNGFYKLIFSTIYIYLIYIIFRKKFLVTAAKRLKSYWFINKNISFLILFVIFILNLFNVLYSLNYKDFKYYIIIVILAFLITLFLNNYLKSIYANKILKIKNTYLESNIANYIRSIEDYSLLKHNLINDLLLIRTYTNKQGKIIIDQKINKYNKDLKWINSIQNIPSGLQGIIYTKAIFAKNQFIDFYVENKITLNMRNLQLQKYLDICEVMSIILDNAIESTIECSTKLVYLNFYNTKSNFIIEVINTFKNQIDMDKIGDKNYSTKNRSTGFGLNYILNLNRDIIIKNMIIDNLFKTKIKIKKINKKTAHQ